MPLVAGVELVDADGKDDFEGLVCSEGLISVAGFGSLLSERSARSTFPDLVNFRLARLRGYRRVFAQPADIFFRRGIARPGTGEVSSLSCELREEQGEEHEIIVSVFETASADGFVKAFVEREHEFRFRAVAPLPMDGSPPPRLAVMCTAFTDDEYRARRCPPEEWARRWGVHGVDKVWGMRGILPCRVYLRHCVLAARACGPETYASFLDKTYLQDRETTVRQHLERDPSIMEEGPPPELVGRYSG